MHLTYQELQEQPEGAGFFGYRIRADAFGITAQVVPVTVKTMHGRKQAGNPVDPAFNDGMDWDAFPGQHVFRTRPEAVDAARQEIAGLIGKALAAMVSLV